MRCRCSRRSATASLFVDHDGTARLWNEAAQRDHQALRPAEVVGRHARHRNPGVGEHRAGAGGPHGRAGAAKSVPLDLGGRELWLSVSAVGFRTERCACVRDLTEAGARNDATRPRGDGLTRGAHAAGGDLSMCGDPAARQDLEVEHGMRRQAARGGSWSRLNGSRRSSKTLRLTGQLDSGKLQMNIELCDPIAIARQEVEAASACGQERRARAHRADDAADDRGRPEVSCGIVLSNLLGQRGQVLARRWPDRDRGNEPRAQRALHGAQLTASACPRPSANGSSTTSTASIPA